MHVLDETTCCRMRFVVSITRRTSFVFKSSDFSNFASSSSVKGAALPDISRCMDEHRRLRRSFSFAGSTEFRREIPS